MHDGIPDPATLDVQAELLLAYLNVYKCASDLLGVRMLAQAADL